MNPENVRSGAGRLLSGELLFFRADRTGYLQEALKGALKGRGVSLETAQVATEPGEVLQKLEGMLKKGNLVLVVSGEQGGIPQGAEPVFQALKIPLDPEKEIRWIHWVSREESRGCLLESQRQGICFLPDVPEKALALLEEMLPILEGNFSLLPKPEEPPLVDFSLQRQEICRRVGDPV